MLPYGPISVGMDKGNVGVLNVQCPHVKTESEMAAIYIFNESETFKL